MSNKRVVIAEHVGKGNTPENRHFRVEETNDRNSELQDGEIRAETLYLSVDPYMRGRLNPGKSYVPAFEVGEPGNGSGVGRIVDSKNPDFQVGDVITSQLDLSWPWQQFVVYNSEKLKKFTKLNQMPENLIPHTIGQLGMPGLTAYFGVLHRGLPKEGEVFVVSGAAGACGTMAGQIAKSKGCRVIGIAGGDEKVNYITSELGFDVGIDYKGKTEEQLVEELRAAAPNGIDVYYDNVGGIISNAVLRLLNTNARVPICGQISQYNEADPLQLPADIEALLKEKNVDRRWFMFGNFISEVPDAWAELVKLVQEDKIKVRYTSFEGIEKMPDAFVSLFSGANIGKLIVKIA